MPQVIFEKGTLNVTTFALDDAGRINGLVIAPAAPNASPANFGRGSGRLRRAAGRVSLLVREVGSAQPPLAALNSGRLLAVASTFKLAILGELQAQINAGQRAWTDEVTLEDADKGLPSGTLQTSRQAADTPCAIGPPA